MLSPCCRSEMKTVDSRHTQDRNCVRRARQCLKCRQRFHTLEMWDGEEFSKDLARVLDRIRRISTDALRKDRGQIPRLLRRKNR